MVCSCRVVQPRTQERNSDESIQSSAATIGGHPPSGGCCAISVRQCVVVKGSWSAAIYAHWEFKFQVSSLRPSADEQSIVGTQHGSACGRPGHLQPSLTTGAGKCIHLCATMCIRALSDRIAVSNHQPRNVRSLLQRGLLCYQRWRRHADRQQVPSKFTCSLHNLPVPGSQCSTKSASAQGSHRHHDSAPDRFPTTLRLRLHVVAAAPHAAVASVVVHRVRVCSAV